MTTTNHNSKTIEDISKIYIEIYGTITHTNNKKNMNDNTRMLMPLPHVPTRDVVLSRYSPKTALKGMGRSRRRRSRGGA